jgi:macrolide phosphotransferase
MSLQFCMNLSPTSASERDLVSALALRHGLELSANLDINELGLDFRVVTTADRSGTPWVLRIPRRADVIKKIHRESRTLELLRRQVPFAVPDWRIVSDELVAYPRLNDPTAIHIEASSGEVIWNIDRNTDGFVASLGSALAALHQIPAEQAVQAGLKNSSPDDLRRQVARDIEVVNGSFGIDPGLKQRWADWLNDDTSWPDFTVVVHVDLYAGHLLVNSQDTVTGMIDWTEAEISDPSIDFTSHLLLFGEGGLESLIHHYETAGGRTWPRMAHHTKERLSLTPIRYALFALESGEQAHMDAARAQLLPP